MEVKEILVYCYSCGKSFPIGEVEFDPLFQEEICPYCGSDNISE